MLIKNHWKAFGMASLLLAASCSEDDAPVATSSHSDSTAVVAPDPTTTGDPTGAVADTVKETVLLNFRANGTYFEEDEILGQQYVLISDQQGMPLVLEPFEQGEKKAIIISGEFTDKKIQVTVMSAGTFYDEGKERKGLIAATFLDVDRGIDWQINPYPSWNEEPIPTGYASLSFENVEQEGYYHGGFRMFDGYDFFQNDQMQDTLSVPIYRTPTPLMTLLDVDQEYYVNLTDDAEAGKSYTVDVKTMQKLTEKSLSSPIDNPNYISASLNKVFVQPNNLDADNTLHFGHSFGSDGDGNAIIKYPGNMFPAYESSYTVEKGNTSYSTRIKGQIPTQFPMPNFLVDITNTSPESFVIETQGDFDSFGAEWESYDDKTSIYWYTIGSPKTTSFRVPLLPDSLAIDTEGLYCDEIEFDEYDHINDHASFLHEFHEKYYDVDESSIRTEHIYYELDNAENGRTRQQKMNNPFMRRRK